MMASSQVEIIAPSHIGCILKERNRKDRRKDTNPNMSHNSNIALQRNLNEFVKDQFKSRVLITSENSNNDFHHQEIGFDYWCKSNSGDRNGEDREMTLPMYKRKSRILDQWATQQAKDMINVSRRHKDLVDFTCLSKTSSLSSRASSSRRDHSPTPSDNSSTDLSVSSLVQKWKGFEAESKNNQANNNNINTQEKVQSLECCNTSESIMTTKDAQETSETIISTKDTQENIETEISQSPFPLQYENPCPSSIDGQEEERIRVADIVRKWANTNQVRNEDGSQECKSFLLPTSLMRLKVGVEIKDQLANFSAIICSPKVRGRQAISQLFKKMERDRYKELEVLRSKLSVSKFPQRGRIQTLLRLKIKRREVCEENKKEVSLSPCVGRLCNYETSSTVNDIRERYSTKQTQENTSETNCRTNVNNIDHDNEKTSTSNENCDENSVGKLTNTERNDDKVHSTKDGQCTKQCFPNNDVQMFSGEFQNHKQDIDKIVVANQDPIKDDPEPLKDDISAQICCNDIELNSPNFETTFAISTEKELSSSNLLLLDDENGKEDDYNIEVMEDGYIDDNGWEEEQEEYEALEQQDDNQQFLDGNLDWTIDIARPRSFWEERRQAWYQEIYSSQSQDAEIRQLLERGSVSSVLASDFRERMDQLVMSSVQRCFLSTQSEEDGVKAIEDIDHDESTTFEKSQTLEFNHQVGQEQVINDELDQNQNLIDDDIDNVGNDDEDDDDDSHNDVTAEHEDEDDIDMDMDIDTDDNDNDNEQEELGTIEKYQDISEESDQVSSPSQIPWIHYHEHEASDDSDHISLTSERKHPTYHSYYHDATQGSSLKNIEMELILDLRAHMQQLHSEMSDLRKSITNCMDMQVKLQQSIQCGIPNSSKPKDCRKEKKSSIKQKREGICILCNEMKIDSLLYRCGHMCTCFTCAKKLHSRCEKCPICQAQIIDVVQIFNEI